MMKCLVLNVGEFLNRALGREEAATSPQVINPKGPAASSRSEVHSPSAPQAGCGGEAALSENPAILDNCSSVEREKRPGGQAVFVAKTSGHHRLAGAAHSGS